MKPWWKVVEPRDEVREGRSFNPDEFAIALEQVVAGTAPADYRKPEEFFARTCFTRALCDHAGMILRRLAGKTANTAPVLTLITQFGGGKTHTLAALYHLANEAATAARLPGVGDLLRAAELAAVPPARVAVFVGNAWDPQDGRETPWIDLARQLAGADGVAALGPAAPTTPPGTEAIGRIFDAAGAPVLILCDEVLNFLNRHRGLAEPFYAFLQNLTVAAIGRADTAAVVSLPRSEVEMTGSDLEWQGKITKVIRRVAKDLIANDEAEISEVVRRRLFKDLGNDAIRNAVARTFADWCFERRAQLPPEWTAVDSAATEKKAKALLRDRFAACYPFHPATLSVFQRKWQALPQYQQTRGTLAMFAQWIHLARRDGYERTRREPLITLGSAPLEHPEFRSTVLGQLGEPRLVAAIEADVSGPQAHSRVLDRDAPAHLKDLHRRVATAILFESSGGQVEKVAHLPELRFALGEPEVDTTSVDNAALALEAKAFFIRRVGSDGFQIRHQATVKKVVNDRRASLDEEREIKPLMRKLVRKEFERGASIPLSVVADGNEVPDSPRLTLAVLDPELEWTGGEPLRPQIAAWTRMRGQSPRLYPGSLVWCVRKPGRDFRNQVEQLLAWRRVEREIKDGVLGSDLDASERADVDGQVREAEGRARDEVWASYRFIVIADPEEEDRVRPMDLGAEHASDRETLCGRVLTFLTSQGFLNESVGAGQLDGNWPPAFVDTGAWPLSSLRQSFLDGSRDRLIDPDKALRARLPELVAQGAFGLASGPQADGSYERVWFEEPVAPEEVAFDNRVHLLKPARARALKSGQLPSGPEPRPGPEPISPPKPEPDVKPLPPPGETVVRVIGKVPPESWNRLGRKIIPKLRSGSEPEVDVQFRTTVRGDLAAGLQADIRQILEDLELTDHLRIQ